MKNIPKYLYHCSPKTNRQSILKNGLIGGHNGTWGIYLSENPDSWKTSDIDLYKVCTDNLNINEFYTVDEKLDETIYFGKIKNKICIPNNNVKLVEE